MKEFSKYFLITMAINGAILFLSFVLPILLLFFFGVLVIELVVGFALALSKGKQEGVGVLAASGVSFIIGISVCSSLSSLH